MSKKKKSSWKTKLKWLILALIVVGVAVLSTRMDKWVPSTQTVTQETPDKIAFDAIKRECDDAYTSQVKRGVQLPYPCADSDIVAIFVKQYGRQPKL